MFLENRPMKRTAGMKENQNLEWKESWRDEFLKWICGFANADGGVLVIGRDDQGQRVGVTNANKLLEDLPNKIRDALGIMADVNLVKKAGKELIEIRVEPYPYPVSYKGEYHYRSGSTKQELKGAALDRFLLRKQGRTWDGVPVPQVTIRSLSGAAITTFRKLARQSQRMERAVLREAKAGLIEKLHLLDGKYLKRDALLLFHPDPERIVTGALVKIGYFRTNAELVYHDEVRGDLFTQVSRTIDILRTKYMKAAITYRGIHRVETFGVPEAALREAVLNAIIHKDYASGAPIQISVYADKLLIWNPGQLPPTWTVAKLKGKHSSQPFNPAIANVFFRAGEIEAWGRGIERILIACRDAGVAEPGIEYEPTGLWMKFTFPQEIVAMTEGGPRPGEARTREKTSERTSEKRLSKTAMAIVERMIATPDITIAELAAKLSRSKRAIELQISKLKQSQVIGRVGPDKGGHWEVLE
jgi:ATP-dependent DNA helicase RecG